MKTLLRNFELPFEQKNNEARSYRIGFGAWLWLFFLLFISYSLLRYLGAAASADLGDNRFVYSASILFTAVFLAGWRALIPCFAAALAGGAVLQASGLIEVNEPLVNLPAAAVVECLGAATALLLRSWLKTNPLGSIVSVSRLLGGALVAGFTLLLAAFLVSWLLGQTAALDFSWLRMTLTDGFAMGLFCAFFLSVLAPAPQLENRSVTGKETWWLAGSVAGLTLAILIFTRNGISTAAFASYELVLLILLALAVWAAWQSSLRNCLAISCATLLIADLIVIPGISPNGTLFLQGGFIAVEGFLVLVLVFAVAARQIGIRHRNAESDLKRYKNELEQVRQSMADEMHKQDQQKQLRLNETRVMELMARNAPLLQVMQQVVGIYSIRDPDAMCSVYLMDRDEQKLHLLCGENLSREWLERTAHIDVNENVGICGAAAARAQPVIYADISKEPNCAELLEYALEAGIRAGWGTPIFSSTHEVLGTFAIYYPYAKEASEDDLWMLNRLGHIAGIAIEKHHSEQALRESEEKYRTVFNFKAWAILMVDVESGLVSDANPTAVDLYGYSLKELQHVALRQLSPSATDLEEKISELRNTDVLTNRCVHKTSSGAYFPVEETASIIHFRGKEFLNLIVRDRTEAEEAERKLEENEKKYELLFNTQRDGHVLADVLAGKIIDCNQAAADMHGYEVAEMIGMPSEDLALDKEFVMKLRDYTANVREYPFHVPLLRNIHRRKDGSEFPAEISISITKIGGKVLRSLMIRDISTQVEAENELKASEQRFKDFAEVAADWFWELDCDLKVTYLSKLYADDDGLQDGSQEQRRQSFQQAIQSNEKLRQHLEDERRKLEPFDDYQYVWHQQELGRRNHRLSGKPVFDNKGEQVGYRGVSRDVTDSLRLTEQLTYQASHDSLTGLVNRREFELRLERVIDSAIKHKTNNALCYLDLDQFKVINDTCGHAAGDQLLCQLAEWLLVKIRSRDTLARLGGDEFGIIMEHCELDDAQRAVQALLDSVSDFQFRWQDKIFRIGMSIGLVPITKHSQTQGQLMSLADSACYAAKDEGRNRVYVTRGELDEGLAQRNSEMHWVARIDSALDKEDQFLLLAQPILDIKQPSTKCKHFELLVRMRDEDGSSIPPGAFLPAAERYNRAHRLDRWVIDKACSWFSRQPRIFDDIEAVAINLSGHSLSDPAFLDFVISKFKQFDIPADKICFEVTETVAIANLSEATKFMNNLKQLGCSFALDDFGSGLSSFAYLKNLPVDYLKIDGVFVKDIADDPIDRAMVKSINDIAHVMGKKTIAEFVESEEILELLKEIGVDYAQGYHISAPISLDDIGDDVSLAS